MSTDRSNLILANEIGVDVEFLIRFITLLGQDMMERRISRLPTEELERYHLLLRQLIILNEAYNNREEAWSIGEILVCVKMMRHISTEIDNILRTVIFR